MHCCGVSPCFKSPLIPAIAHTAPIATTACGVQEPFLCPRCIKLAGPGASSGGKPLTVEFARASGGEAAWRLAQLLATRDYR